MRIPRLPTLLALTGLLSAGLLSAGLAGCASTTDTSATAGVEIPADAVESTRTESNGDIVSEYRVGGRLAVVKITPARGPVYYLTDHDGDGRIDRNRDGTRDVPVYFKIYGW